MTTTASALPHWDMTVVYPSLESPEFEAGFQAVVAGIDELARVFEQYEIGQQAGGPPAADAVTAFEAVLAHLNTVLADRQTLGAYINGFVATNSRDTLAQAKRSELDQQGVRLAQLSTRFTAWIGSLDVDALLNQSESARAHEYMLRKAQEQARHLMSPAEEALVAELAPSASTAWSNLHDNVTSQLEVPGPASAGAGLPMPEVRNLAYDPDREVRRRAYEAELAAWERAAVPLAAALNSIKGEVNTLSRHRRWESPLDVALFNNNIDRATLDAILTAARESFPDFRRYLQAKARALGLPALAWYDLFAPVGESNAVWEFDRSADFIVTQFGTYSQKLSDYAARAFREHWIDAEPRPGKIDGAFCMWLRRDESRILSNYKAAFDGMSTLAHELGHGYHNLNLANRTILQRGTPMTLAETASIFCETIVRRAGLKEADAQEQLAILEASLQGSCQVVVDITSRFLFEQAVFDGRRRRELSVDELNAAMLDAQRQTYGDGLDPALLHPYMWAVKSHYYSTRSFYNFPYMFGLLFGLGLYARYEQDPAAFRSGYDDLLSSTGLTDAPTLAARFGIDVRTPDFWRGSLDVIRAEIDRFVGLVGA